MSRRRAPLLTRTPSPPPSLCPLSPQVHGAGSDPDPREERRWAPPRSPGGAAEGTFVDSNQLFEWKLDEMRLVVESQLVLYRNPFKQAMSLKLVNVDERVTMLTCLSAWLDNIFAGVPELAVCYHRDGVVKGCAAKGKGGWSDDRAPHVLPSLSSESILARHANDCHRRCCFYCAPRYETIKTEGIPYLCEPNFEPAEVRNVSGAAQSLFPLLRDEYVRKHR